MGELLPTALTTLQRVSTELGIKGSTNNGILNELINDASGIIEAECDRKFHYLVDHIEQAPGYGDRRLVVVDHVPIVSITSIQFRQDNGTLDTLDAALYLIAQANLGWIQRVGNNWRWTVRRGTDITGDPLAGTEEHRYLITYIGGYVTPAQEDDTADAGAGALVRNLPRDIERAAIDLTKDMWFGRKRNTDVLSKKVSKASTTYKSTTNSDALYPASVQRVIDRYRRIS